MVFKKGHKGYWSGRKRSEDTIKKMSESMKGRVISEETKNKMSVSKTKEKHNRWKGGKYINKGNYVYVLEPNHPQANNKGYIYEHRLVIEKKLGRYLTEDEVVHHINSVGTDNSEGNLMLFSSHSKHRKFETRC